MEASRANSQLLFNPFKQEQVPSLFMRLWIRWAHSFFFFPLDCFFLIRRRRRRKRGSCVALVGVLLIWNRVSSPALSPPASSPLSPLSIHDVAEPLHSTGHLSNWKPTPLTHTHTQPPGPASYTPSHPPPYSCLHPLPLPHLPPHSLPAANLFEWPHKRGDRAKGRLLNTTERLVESRLWCPPAPSSGSSLFSSGDKGVSLRNEKRCNRVPNNY